MDIKEIKQIIDLMKRSDLTEFEIEEQDLKLRICRDSKHAAAAPVQVAAAPLPAAPQAAPAPATPAAATEASAPAADDPNIKIIKSPMVGSFYRSPSPESSAFVEIGSKVTAETVVCIIEAMKVMNEIQAEIGGTIVEVLAENGQAIEYGQPLFKVKTS